MSSGISLYFLYQTLCTGPMSFSLSSLAVFLPMARAEPEFIPLSHAPSADHLYTISLYTQYTCTQLTRPQSWAQLCPSLPP